MFNPRFREKGISLGYPRCCVDFFCDVLLPYIEMTGESYYPNAGGEAWQGTGYVPCPTCRPFYNLDPAHFVQDVIQPRRHPSHPPFPEDYR